MNRYFFFFINGLLFFLVWGHWSNPGYAEKNNPSQSSGLSSRIIVKLGNKTISESDIKARMDLFKQTSEDPKELKKIKQKVFRQLLSEMVQITVAEQHKIMIEEQKIQEDFQKIAERNGKTREEFLKELSSTQKIPYTLRSMIKARLSWEQYLARFPSRICESCLSPEEKTQAYTRFTQEQRERVEYKVSWIYAEISLHQFQGVSFFGILPEDSYQNALEEISQLQDADSLKTKLKSLNVSYEIQGPALQSQLHQSQHFLKDKSLGKVFLIPKNPPKDPHSLPDSFVILMMSEKSLLPPQEISQEEFEQRFKEQKESEGRDQLLEKMIKSYHSQMIILIKDFFPSLSAPLPDSASDFSEDLVPDLTSD